MRCAFALVFALTLVVAGGAAMAEQGPYPQTEEALQAEYDKLNWQFEPVTYRLASSHSAVTLPQNYALLTGEDAQRMLFLDNGVEFPQTEAIVAQVDGNAYISFDYFETGYVTDDDWSDLDPAVLLAQIQENTAANNEERAKHGLPPLHVTRWVKEPSYDAEARIARWAVEVTSGGEPGVNMSVIRLSRKGYHEVMWVGSMDELPLSDAALDTALGAHQYEPGFRYADFTTGDKLAGFGIASLVAVAAGGEKTKGLIAGLAAAALLFLKKGWFVVIAVLAGGWAGVKRFLGRRQKAAAPVASERSDRGDSGGAA